MKNTLFLVLLSALLIVREYPVFAQEKESPATSVETPIPSIEVTTSAPTSAMIYRGVDLLFKPEDAFFFVDFGEELPIRIRGAIVPTLVQGSLLTDTRSYLVGAKIPLPPGKEVFHFSVLIVGRDNKFFLLADQDQDLQLLAQTPSNTDLLRDKLLQRKEVLKSWLIQTQAQQESLQRLREDASVIGNLSRIVEIKDEVERTNNNIRNLDRDLENQKGFLKLAKARPTPKNYVTREGQLTTQISELAQSAKSAESQEFSRKSKAEGELQRKLAIIEDTRLDDYDDLQRQILRLRQQRVQIEKDIATQFDRR